jgi:UDP-glucose 4-epimerase
MTIAWVLGGGGLLGSALCRSLRQEGTALFVPAEYFAWVSETALASQLTEAVRAFAAAAHSAKRWEIYWAAGIGTMGSREPELTPETQTLSHLIRLLKAEPTLMITPGGFAFASSAGAIYGGSTDPLISENTPPAPTSPYAREKLRQEELLAGLADHGKAVLVARISTLYGPGQAPGKKQGLITHMARCMLKNQLIQIYVPLDTIRDYITADDAALEVIATLRMRALTPDRFVKIVASERGATIAQIVSAFKTITRRSPRIVTTSSILGNLYSRRVQFKSVVGPCRRGVAKTTLLVGIAQVMASEHRLLAGRPASSTRRLG